MSAYTLAMAREFIRDKNQGDSSTRAQRTELRVANHALARLRLGRGTKVESDRKQARLAFAALQQGPGLVKLNSTVQVDGNGSATYSTEAIGKYLYINNEMRPYLVSAYVLSGGTIHRLTIDTYLGDITPGLGDYYSFGLTDERQMLPADFRSMDDADQGSMLSLLEPVKSVAEFDKVRSRYSYYGVPRFYAVESGLVSGEKRSFLRIYPAPTEKTIVDFWYYGGPTVFVAGGETTQYFDLPATPEAQLCIEKYLKAELKDEQGNTADAQAIRAEADELAKMYRVRTQALNDDGEREVFDGGVCTVYRTRFEDGIVETP